MTFFNDLIVKISTSFEILKLIFWKRRRFTKKVDLNGKVVLVTGANTGIGKETVYQLALSGAKVIIGSRNVEKGENAAKDIRSRYEKANVVVMKLDLASFASIRQFAKELKERESKLDILVNNAGVMRCPYSTTEDGFEMQFGTNHLGHFLLTLSVMSLLQSAPKARIVNVSAALYVFGKIHFENINLRNNAYTPLMGYYQSKLANILFTKELATRLGSKSSVNAYSLHPGVIETELQRSFPKWMTRLGKILTISLEMGVQTTLYCALDDSLDNESGYYYDDCQRVKRMTTNATNEESAKRLWEMSCDLTKLEDHFRIN
ncbi:retinol dehydrogenase 11-like [Oppia nitens]|uniref:retinol dehydrogenase 11-like n=1 Tax=Oppia nitens TaxID=1686743 RepID=UPI0023DCC0C7|nr:retinol dehydrogenase 11-like [Oppia nitens]